VQQALQKHFKGWLESTADLPINPVVGDYAYVEDNGTTYIYRCTIDGEWPMTSTEEKEPADVTFAGGQEVNETYIDDTHLANPKDGALPTAADVLQLKAKLDGVTATETKQSFVLESGYINYDGSIRESTHKHVVIELGAAKKVRFLGQTISSQSSNNLSYAFWNAATYVDSSTVVFSSYYDVRTGDASEPKEYLVSIPDGATHIAISVGSLIESNFYCYLQSGETVTNLIDDVNTEIDAIRKTTSPCVFEYVQGLYISSNGVISTSSSGIGNSYQIAYTKVNDNDIIDFVAIPSLARNLNTYSARIRVGFTREIPTTTLTVDGFKVYSDSLKLYNAIIIKDSLVTPFTGYFCVFYPIVYQRQCYDINLSTITTVKKDNQIGVCQGRVLNGHPDGDKKYVTSDYIKGGVYFDLVCREGYKINSVNLYDDSGNLICANFFGEAAYNGWRYRNRDGWGSILPPHIMARVTIVKNSSGCTADDDCLVADRPIKSLTYLDEANGYALDVPQDIEDAYPIVKYRALTLVNIISRYLRQRENYRVADTGLSHGNDYYELSNRQYCGVAYSDSRLKSTTVGIDVSLYTYITALSHKYSVVYTEDTFTNKSSYGITYPLGLSYLANNYYNMACNMYYAYCFGLYALKIVSYIINSDYTAIFIGSGSPSGLISDNIQALDTLIKNGHVALVLDVIKKGDEIKYVVVAESSTPFTRITVFPKSDFDTIYMTNQGTVERPNYYNIYRKNQIDISTYAQPFDLDNGDYVAHYNNEYPYVGSEKECMLYVGDRASLSTDDPVFVNVNRSYGRYTKLDVYKDDVLLESVDISALTAWTNDPDGEDWVKVDLTSVVDGYGKYKAQASNADDSETSNETIWEIIDVELSVSGDTANFSVNGGWPYMLQEEQKLSGFLHDGQCDLLDPSDTSHDISDYTKSTSAFDLALYAIGDYGMVKKIVSRN